MEENTEVKEEVTEEVTEESVEEETEEKIELPLSEYEELKHKVEELEQNVEDNQKINKNLEQIDLDVKLLTEKVGNENNGSKEPVNPQNESDIVYLNDNADTHLYLTTEVQNAGLNDVFTVALSVRNILLLFFLMWLVIKIFDKFKNVFYRIFNK